MSTNSGNSVNNRHFDSDNSITNDLTVEKESTTKKIEQEIEEKELSKKKLHIIWRRGKVLEYLADGFTNQSEIAEKLHVSDTVIGEDIQILKAQAKERIRLHLEERLPFVFEQCLVRLEKTKREAIEICSQTQAPRIKLQALSLMSVLQRYLT
jgi:hypothetical protein